MRARLWSGTLGLCLTAASGCGAIAARIPGSCGCAADEYPVYSGVCFDVDALDHGGFHEQGNPLIVADLPFSFVLDTLLLPVDVARWMDER